ncbi:ribonuclease [Sphingomonas sp.]|uniref:ribonuclease n=1 Tax=Sphingomonas sp. TaxID=28214 RepID=UPI00286B378D|nr:ribonuclease [Sphingomonas sp.]
MPEWLIERGIGETRAILVDGGTIVEARVMLAGQIAAGLILKAKLKTVGRNAIALADGIEFLLPKGAPGVTQGAALTIEVAREAIGIEGWKRPLARVSDAPAAIFTFSGRPLAVTDNAFDDAGWPDLIEEARSGIVGFRGGALRVAVTPAMTLIDVDGSSPPGELAIAGATASAKAIRRHGIGGSIGIDLPTDGGKAARHAAAEAIDLALPQPFERTAVNGFGFVQIVRPRRHASLFELALNRPAFEARALLRSAARQMGKIELVAHPAVLAAMLPDWTDQLARQIGGAVALRSDPSLGIAGGHAVRR